MNRTMPVGVDCRAARPVCVGPVCVGGESGYSLVEVIASIVILSVAIIPMVGMFDAGLRAANTGGNYDRARTLANLVLEKAKSLPYEEVRDDFPAALTTPAGGKEFAGLDYRVEKRYLKWPPSPDSSEVDLSEGPGDGGLIKITVTVRWGGDKEYSTTGVVADGAQ